MKKKLFYLLALTFCLATYSSAKQVYKGNAKDCYGVCKQVAKKAPVKTKKGKAATIRPFNFYLINL